MHGILNINKPAGITSHNTVIKIRKLIKASKVGHTGTLDPMASGVLPLCIGQATRITRFLSAEQKQYRALARLGLETDTLDRTGQILREHGTFPEKEQALLDIIPAFKGQLEQIPPMFSAIKQNGQPLYKLARRGISVARPPRPVHIYRLEMTRFSPPYFTLEITCSAGTYIRSLTADIGTRLGCGATLWELERTRCGDFCISDSIDLQEAADLAVHGLLINHITTIKEALSRLPRVTIKKGREKMLFNGVNVRAPAVEQLSSPNIEKGALVQILASDGRLLALGNTLLDLASTQTVTDQEDLIHPHTTFQALF